MVIAKGPRALLLNGTVGVGKSTLAAAIAGVLSNRGVPNAYIDMDELRRSWPAPPDDRFNSSLALDNLSSVSTNFVRAGVQRLVVAGVVETARDRSGYASALGMPLVMCRLRVTRDVLAARLLARHTDEAELRWHLDRAPELDLVLDAACLDDHSIDVSTSTIANAAEEVLGLVGWIS